MNHTKILLIALFVFAPFAWGEEALHPWDVFEITLNSQQQLANPYVESNTEEEAYLQAIFTGTGGDAQDKELSIPGFWDGGTQWKIRFAPPCSGTWTYKTLSKDSSLNGQSGGLTVQPWSEDKLKENPTRHGLVQVCTHGERAGRYFEYTDGTPFLWIGDTWWNWTKKNITLASFQKLADDRSAKGFTVGQLFFAGRGWGRESSLLNETFDHPDIDHIQSVEAMIRYANAKGITVWVHGWWGSPQLDKQIGAEAMSRWCRYMVRRLAAYNVIWVLAGEYNIREYGGLGLDFWNGLGTMIKKEDPYSRITGVHPTPPGWSEGDGAPQWSTADVIHDQPWLDYNQSQVGHSKWRNERIPAVVTEAYLKTPPKPIVVTEPWYEFIQGTPSAEDIRFGAWSAILSGAAGHTYGGGHVWKAHVPESPVGKDGWPMEMDFQVNTLDYPGAQSIAFLSHFLHSIEWWKLEPHPEYVLENPSLFCSANPGEEYVLFLRWGGRVKIDLRAAAANSTFAYQWIDLVNQNSTNQGRVTGGDFAMIGSPEDYPGVPQYKDWILHLKKVQE